MQTNNAHECYCARRHWPTLYAIVNDRLSVLELAKTLDMGHRWASDVTLSNIHERYSLTSPFLLYKNKKVSIKTP